MSNVSGRPTRPRPTVSWPVAAAVIVVCTLGSNMPTALYGLLRDQIGFSAATQTAIFGAYMIGVLPGLLVVGPLSDRYGRRPILQAALALTVLASVGFLFADSVPLLVIIRLLQGVSVGAATVAGVACFFETMTARRTAIAALLAAATIAVGAALGPPIGGLLAELFGRSVIAPYVVQLGLVLLTAVALLLSPARTVPDASGPPADPSPAPDGTRPPRDRLPSMTMTCFLAGWGWIAVGLFQAVGPALLSAALGITHLGVLGAAVALVMTASAIVTMLTRRWPVPQLRGTGLLLSVIGCTAMAVTLTTGSAAVAVTAALTVGAAQGLIFLSATKDLAVLSAAAPPNRGALLSGVFYTCAYLSAAIPTFGVGVLADSIGLTPAALTLLAVIAAGSALLLAWQTYRWVTIHRHTRTSRRPTRTPKSSPPIVESSIQGMCHG